MGGGGGARVAAGLSPPPWKKKTNISLFGGLFATCSPCWGLFCNVFLLRK